MTRAYGSGRKKSVVTARKIRVRHPSIKRLGFSCWRLVPTYDGDGYAALSVGATSNSMAVFRIAR